MNSGETKLLLKLFLGGEKSSFGRGGGYGGRHQRIIGKDDGLNSKGNITE